MAGAAWATTVRPACGKRITAVRPSPESNRVMAILVGLMDRHANEVHREVWPELDPWRP